MTTPDVKRASLYERGETPLEELEALKACALVTGSEIIIDFEGRDGEACITVTIGDREADADLIIAERATRLAPYLIRCDIPDWDEGPGSEGRLRIGAHDDPWLDAVDRNEDWLLERSVDIDALSEMTWEDDIPGPFGF